MKNKGWGGEKGNDDREPLYIIIELVSPNDIISNHNPISFDATLAPKYSVNQEQATLHFEDTFRMLRT